MINGMQYFFQDQVNRFSKRRRKDSICAWEIKIIKALGAMWKWQPTKWKKKKGIIRSIYIIFPKIENLKGAVVPSKLVFEDDLYVRY